VYIRQEALKKKSILNQVYAVTNPMYPNINQFRCWQECILARGKRTSDLRNSW